MKLAPIRDWLAPRRTEADEGFRQEMLSLGARGLLIVGFVEAGLALVALAGLMPWQAAALLLLVAILTAGASRISAAYDYSRAIGACSCAIASIIAARTIMLGRGQDFALGAITVLVLTAAVALPLVPLQSLSIGLAALAAGYDCDHLLLLAMLALTATAVTATLYTQRRANYHSYLSVLQGAQDVRSLQSRLLVAENSATMVHLSAALAHELSQPVGTVSSGIDTLLLLCARHATASPGEQQRLQLLQEDLGRSLLTSMERLKKMVNRIQRITVLDEAGTRNANVNELLHEAVAIVKPQAPETAHINADLQSVPEIRCRPQQLIAVFSTVLTNSIQAIPPDGHISISSRQAGDRLEIRIADDGRGISADRLAHIFDPGFQVTEGRVATANWSLFTSRQFMKDHGGEMRIQSQEGQGTTVSLILPCSF